MRRRDFINFLGGAAASPFAALSATAQSIDADPPEPSGVTSFPRNAGSRSPNRYWPRSTRRRSLRATKLQELLRIRLPYAVPFVFSGLKLSITAAVTGAIVGEFVGARQGLGVDILKANFALDLASVFASLIVLAVIGVALNAAVRAIERRVCFWSGTKRT